MFDLFKELLREIFSKQTKLYNAIRNKDVNRVFELVESGANPGVKTESTRWPIIVASQEGLKEVVSFFIKKGVDVNVQGEFGDTPLYISLRYDHEEIAKMLIDAGADIHAICYRGEQPLAKAVLLGSYELVEIMLNRGADVNHRDREGETALMVATRKGNAEIVSLLLDHNADINIENSDHLTAPELAMDGKIIDQFLALAVKQNNIALATKIVRCYNETDLKKALNDAEKLNITEITDLLNEQLTRLAQEQEKQRLNRKKQAEWEKEEKRIIATLEDFISKVSSSLTIVNKEERKKKESRVREIGRRLHNRGGMNEMRRIFSIIEDKPGARVLEMVWNGIGDWRG